MSDIVTVGKKYQVVIPKKIREKINLKEGNSLFIDVIDDSIAIFVIPKSITEIAGIGKGLYEENYSNNIREEWHTRDSF